MALRVKILRGDSSRISTDITPFHDGWWYYCTNSGEVYIDSEIDGKQMRTCINPKGVAAKQNVDDAGKVLGIDGNGDVIPVSALRWGDLNGANQGGD